MGSIASYSNDSLCFVHQDIKLCVELQCLPERSLSFRTLSIALCINDVMNIDHKRRDNQNMVFGGKICLGTNGSPWHKKLRLQVTTHNAKLSNDVTGQRWIIV